MIDSHEAAGEFRLSGGFVVAWWVQQRRLTGLTVLVRGLAVQVSTRIGSPAVHAAMSSTAWVKKIRYVSSVT